MTHDVIVALAALGVVAQVLCVCIGVAALLRLFGVRGPLDAIGGLLWGYEFWAAFVVDGGRDRRKPLLLRDCPLRPCELCWFHRICMYPLSITTLLMAVAQRPPRRRLRPAAPGRGCLHLDLTFALLLFAVLDPGSEAQSADA